MTSGPSSNNFNVGSTLGSGFGEEVELSIRMTDRAYRLIDEVIDPAGNSQPPQSRAEFLTTAVSSNSQEILMMVEGQKAIRDFAKDLSDDVTWINIKPESKYRLNTKIEPDQSVADSPQSISMYEETKDTIDQIVRCTDLGQSDVVRICIIKQLYTLTKDIGLENNNSDEAEASVKNQYMTKTKRKVIAERWLDIENKLQRVVDELIFDIHCEVLSEKFSELIKLESYSSDVRAITDHYKYDFKQSSGYGVMRNNQLGKEVIDELDSVVEG